MSEKNLFLIRDNEGEPVGLFEGTRQEAGDLCMKLNMAFKLWAWEISKGSFTYRPISRVDPEELLRQAYAQNQ